MLVKKKKNRCNTSEEDFIYMYLKVYKEHYLSTTNAAAQNLSLRHDCVGWKRWFKEGSIF